MTPRRRIGEALEDGLRATLALLPIPIHLGLSEFLVRTKQDERRSIPAAIRAARGSRRRGGDDGGFGCEGRLRPHAAFGEERRLVRRAVAVLVRGEDDGGVVLRFGGGEEANSDGPADDDAEGRKEDEVCKSSISELPGISIGRLTGESASEHLVLGVSGTPLERHLLADERLHKGDREGVGVLEHGAGDCSIVNIVYGSREGKDVLAKLRCERLRRSSPPIRNATVAERMLMMTNPTGMIARSLSLSGEREKATLEKRRAGVKSDTLSLLRTFLAESFTIPFFARIHPTRLCKRGVRRHPD